MGLPSRVERRELLLHRELEGRQSCFHRYGAGGGARHAGGAGGASSDGGGGGSRGGVENISGYGRMQAMRGQLCVQRKKLLEVTPEGRVQLLCDLMLQAQLGELR